LEALGEESREGEEPGEVVREVQAVAVTVGLREALPEMLGEGERVGLSELVWDVLVLGESVTVGQVLAEGVL